MKILSLILCFVAPIAVPAQPADSLGLEGKLIFHAESVYSPWSIAGSAAYAGLLQDRNFPEEWAQGSGAYGKRLASTVGGVAVHAALAFGLDTTLRQDPRYFRSGGAGFWRRSGHALRGTVLTRTDGGGETLSTWRLGSVYGAAFLSNQWYPDRLNTVRQGVLRGSFGLGLEVARNFGSEFWPDVKRRLLRQAP